MSLSDLALGFGFVALIEGLVLALAPRRFNDMLRILAEMPLETRRWMGLSILSFGAILIWLARG